MKNLFRLSDGNGHRTDGENGWRRRLADAFKARGRGGFGNGHSKGTRRPLFEPLEQRQLLTAAPNAVGYVPGHSDSDFVAEQYVADSISAAGEVDEFTIDLQEGETLAILADGDVALRPHIELLTPGGASLGSSTAAAAAGQAGLEAITAPSTGTYTITVSGAAGTVGSYGVKMLLNATLESESYTQTANDTPATAQDLDSAFLSLDGGTAEVASVAGTLPGYFEGFESGVLDQRWQLETPSQAVTELTDVHGAAEGDTAMVLHWNGEPDTLDFPQSAIWNVDLTGLDNPVLTFQAEQSDYWHWYEGESFEGQDSTDNGVFISNDGYHWYPATEVRWSGDADAPWVEYSVDLAAAAEDAGLSLDQELQIKFQRHSPAQGDEYDGVAYDAICITATPNADWYQFTLEDGQAAAIGYAGENSGSATVELYDSNLNLITMASATASGDGMIQPYTDSTTDSQPNTYFVKVTGSSSDYQLSVLRDPDFEVTGDFVVTGSTPADGELVQDPTTFQVEVSHDVLASSLDASDLKIDGQAAASVRLVDGRTIEFTLPTGITEKTYTATIAAGAITDIDGQAIAAMTSTFQPDLVSPYLVGASLTSGDIVESGDLEVELQFNETLLASVLDAADVQLVGIRTGSYTPAEFSYNAATSTLSLVYDDLPDDSYTLTLVSGAEAFRDTVGHGLDGGDIEIQFGTYVDEVPLSMESIGPAAADASVGSAQGMVTGSSADTYAVSAVAGDTISVSLEPDSDLRATIELVRPDGSVYASATATSAGEPVSLQNIPVTVSGVYSVAVRGVDGSAGEYQVNVLLNAVREDQALDEETVENLDSWFLPLDDQGDQIVVYGSLYAIGESFDSLEVDDSWWMADESIAFVSDEWGSVDGDSALMMHGGRGGATWTVDVSEIENPILSFWHASWEGAGQSLNWHESWSSGEDDGIIIDAVNGDVGDRYKWIPPEQETGEWVYYSFNLADIAEETGETLASVYQFYFQQVDWFVSSEAVCGYISDRLLPEVGRGWDAILVTSGDPIGDWYEFSLEDGETADLVMTAEGMPAESVLEIYDDAGNLLATGEVDADGTVTIEGFRDLTTDGAADNYHVRAGAVVTTPEWPYSLVITRDTLSADDSTPFEILGVTAGAETVGTVPTLDITFSDDLAVNSVDAEDFLINGVPAESVRVFNSTTIRVQPRVLTSGTWDLQVAAGAVTDIQGTALEAFSTSVTVTSADALLSEELLHETRFLGELDSAGQTDSWQVQLEAGQRMTIVLMVDDDLAGNVSLTGPDGSQVASGTAAVGEFVVVEYTASSAGTYTLAVSGADGTQGEYEGTLVLNAIVDPASVVDTADDDDANDSAASAVALDSVFFDIADGGQAATVRGSLACSTTFVTEEDFTAGGGEEPETDFLLNGWWVDANRGELPRPRLGYGDGVLSFPAGYYESASQTEDIAGYYEANWSRGIPYNVDTANAITLEFDFRVSDADVRFTPFSGAFTDEANATGIAISNDEETWYPVWNAQLQTVGEWVHYSIDLSAAAEAAGITLSNLTRIRFQYYAPVGTEGTGDESIAFDNLVVSDKVATEEWYQFDLAAGQTVAAVVDSDASIQIDVLDAQLNVVASGAAGAGVQQAIDQVTASTSGTYYLRVTGTGGAYSLAVACDASTNWAQSVTVPEYVVGERLAEHTIAPAVDIEPVDPVDTGGDESVPTNGGYGQNGAPIEFGTPVSETDLGTVVHQEMTGLDLTGGTLSFRLQPANTAYMTVIGNAVDSGTIYIKLTDAISGETIYSVEVNGEQRLDMSSNKDRSYILEVTGTSANVSLELLNLVAYRSGAVKVLGTDDADHVVFDATTGLDVSILGITYPFRDFEDLDASFTGGEGDKVTLIGSAGDEEITLTPDSGEMTGEGWQVSVSDVTSYEVFGGGGSDTAYLNDSPGDDLYESRPGLTTMTGSGFDMTVNDVETCHGYAKAGGVDTAILHSADGRQSKFKSDGEAGYAKLYGSSAFTRAKFFEVVEAYNHADTGLARLFDSAGDDQFYGQEDESRMVTSEYDVTIYGFAQLTAYGKAGGTDTATLTDSAADDEVRFRPHKTEMYDLDTKGDVFTLTARAFDSVHAEAVNGGDDKAKIHDTTSDDLFEAEGNSASLSSARTELELLYDAVAFEFVKAYGTEGTDRAEAADQLDFELYYDGDWQ